MNTNELFDSLVKDASARAKEIMEIVNVAVAAEREACAQLVESMEEQCAEFGVSHTAEIAAAIRARSL